MTKMLPVTIIANLFTALHCFKLCFDILLSELYGDRIRIFVVEILLTEWSDLVWCMVVWDAVFYGHTWGHNSDIWLIVFDTESTSVAV